MKIVFQILIFSFFTSSDLFSQDESFSLINSSGDTLFVIDETGEVRISGDVFIKGYLSGTPIGTIVAWDKNLSGVPSLKDGWVECNGQILNDPNSPLNGQTIPNLNVGIFLRGNSTTGGTGGSNTTSTYLKNGGGINTRLEAQTNGDYVRIRSGNYSAGVDYSTQSFNILPPYYDIVWIIRVK